MDGMDQMDGLRQKFEGVMELVILGAGFGFRRENVKKISGIEPGARGVVKWSVPRKLRSFVEEARWAEQGRIGP